jgi:hypothetical protein
MESRRHNPVSQPPTNGGKIIPMPSPEPMVQMFLVGSDPAAILIQKITGHVISAVVKFGSAVRISFEDLTDHLIIMGCYAPSFSDPIEISPGRTEVALVSKPTVAIGIGQFEEVFESWDGEEFMKGRMVSGYSPGKSLLPAGPNNAAGEYPSLILELNSGRFLIATPFTVEVSDNARPVKPS